MLTHFAVLWCGVQGAEEEEEAAVVVEAEVQEEAAPMEESEAVEEAGQAGGEAVQGMEEGAED
jgi:hypothetical protein